MGSSVKMCSLGGPLLEKQQSRSLSLLKAHSHLAVCHMWCEETEGLCPTSDVVEGNLKSVDFDS